MDVQKMDALPVAFFTGVSAAALREAGVWPDPGAAVDDLLAALDQRIADAPSPEEKGKLARARDAIKGLGRDLTVEVIGSVITGRLPL